MVNLFNPKTAIFFLAFLPQFVEPARGEVHWQILVLGLTFTGLGIISNGMLALAAGAPGELLRRNRRFLRLQRWFAGTSFIGIGVTAAPRRANSPAIGPSRPRWCQLRITAAATKALPSLKPADWRGMFCGSVTVMRA